MEVSIAVIPCTKVMKVKLLNISRVLIFPNCDTTQKYESLACETVIAPPPIASIKNVSRSGLSKPADNARGDNNADVIMSEEVLEPCAVFKIAAMI
jgi:hypothetical protein